MENQDQAQEDQPAAAVPEEQWGQKVESLAVNGVEETARKFRAHVRRALILYVLLLKDTRDLEALRGLVTALRGRDFASYSDLSRSDFDTFYGCICNLSCEQVVARPAQFAAGTRPHCWLVAAHVLWGCAEQCTAAHSAHAAECCAWQTHAL